MTSIEFFRPPEKRSFIPLLDWGRARPVIEPFDITLPHGPTWHYSGEPIPQYYSLTHLKNSKVRSNDELIPKPTSINIGKSVINLPFPAEHPTGSHISRFAVFPKFDSPEDPKRGVAARSEQPISSEMPANPFHTKVNYKAKGFPYYYELVDIPTESEKTALYWPGEDFFNQYPKIKGYQPKIYPTPPKIICPNLQERGKDLSVSARTANALRNVERDHWRTTYNIDYTGLGPSNPPVLDNLEEKQRKLMMTGVEDDKLYPHSVNTFDPPRPLEGRLPSKCAPVPIHVRKELTYTNGDKPQNQRMRNFTSREREEHRLLNGAEYINLPDTTFDPNRDDRWQQMDELQKIEERKRIQLLQERGAPPEVGKCRKGGTTYLAEAKAKQDDAIQEMEAQNRWKMLEHHSPSHERTALHNQMKVLHDSEKPATFYNKEGRYNEERSALYKTSYDPHHLKYGMDSAFKSPAELLSTLHSNRQAEETLSFPAYRLNQGTNAGLNWSRTDSLVKPELSGDRREGKEVLDTFCQLKACQADRLQPPEPHQADALVQEREFLENEDTTMGKGYNVKKFLQENTMDRYARNEPLNLMSTENQNLDRVRACAIPRGPRTVQFNESVKVATISPTSTPPVNIQTQALEGEALPYHAPPLSSEMRWKPSPIQQHYISTRTGCPPEYTSTQPSNLPQYTSTQTSNLSQYTSTQTSNLPQYASVQASNLPQYTCTQSSNLPQFTCIQPSDPAQFSSTHGGFFPQYTSTHASYPSHNDTCQHFSQADRQSAPNEVCQHLSQADRHYTPYDPCQHLSQAERHCAPNDPCQHLSQADRHCAPSDPCQHLSQADRHCAPSDPCQHLSQAVRHCAPSDPCQHLSQAERHCAPSDTCQHLSQAERHSSSAAFRSEDFFELPSGDENNNSDGKVMNQEFDKDSRPSFYKRPASWHGHGVLDTEYTDRFRSSPGDLRLRRRRRWITCPEDGCPEQVALFDLGYKNDARFQWEPGCGVPRPQSCLGRMQDAFIQTEVRQRFHERFPENAPDLRDNHNRGKGPGYIGRKIQVIQEEGQQ